jgi:hypothetical protein
VIAVMRKTVKTMRPMKILFLGSDMVLVKPDGKREGG